MKLKLLIIFIFSLILIGVGAFVVGRTTSNISIDRITSSPYEKCMYQCMEGHKEVISYCRPYIADFIDNYDKYYSPSGVSSAFADTYSDKANPQSQDTAYKVLCFRSVVGCKVNSCKNYL